MTVRYIDFLVDPTGKSPSNLKNSIGRVFEASAGFRQSWLSGNRPEALRTSQEAFEHLDYIQNELLRQRDVHKKNTATWPTSLFCATLNAPVGRFIQNVSDADLLWFQNLVEGAGAMPVGPCPTPLALNNALNKLKHRDPVAVNFSLPADTDHILYLFTMAGMGQPNSLSEINVSAFCAACSAAALHI